MVGDLPLPGRLRSLLAAVLLSAWHILIRSPLPAPLGDPGAYHASVTLHGTTMAYVVTTFFVMGFGYAVTATGLGRSSRDGLSQRRIIRCAAASRHSVAELAL